ncbi:MAG: amidohydrolase [Oscillospiraceae bacterium]|nr:amidohydrolase [Oscillospiraceae bacterium]
MDSPESLILSAIDNNRERLIKFAQNVYASGEPGFREFSTAKKVTNFLETLGLMPQTGLAITGVKAGLGLPGLNIAAVAELDGIACPAHPFANPANGVSHSCGHNAQITAMLGAAIALSQPEIKALLGGNVTFFAVPSEEYTDIEYKTRLIEDGKIRYGGGKAELISLGAFDDVNLCVTHHLHMVKTGRDLLLGLNTTNGFVVKQIEILGKASHAAIAPHRGINALNAASLGLSALAYQRETFRDTDFVRVHAIMTDGGSTVNVVPSKVTLEAQVRAKTVGAMQDAAQKTDRAFQAGAHALGARAVIKDLPGYLPVLEYPVPKAMEMAGSLLAKAYSVGKVDPEIHNCASTDVGDLSHLMPTLGFTTGGFIGDLHSAGFTVTDVDKAYVLPAKVMAMTIFNLLQDKAREAHGLLERFSPPLTKTEYLAYLGS